MLFLIRDLAALVSIGVFVVAIGVWTGVLTGAI
jgi:hypothetical protein